MRTLQLIVDVVFKFNYSEQCLSRKAFDPFFLLFIVTNAASSRSVLPLKNRVIQPQSPKAFCDFYT
jgi:hypothetical protein